MVLVQSSEENNCRTVVIWRQNPFEAASASQEKAFERIVWPVSQFGSHLFGHNTPLHRGEPFLNEAPLSPRQLMPFPGGLVDGEPFERAWASGTALPWTFQALPAHFICSYDISCQLYQDGRFKIPQTDGEAVERAWAEMSPLAAYANGTLWASKGRLERSSIIGKWDTATLHSWTCTLRRLSGLCFPLHPRVVSLDECLHRVSDPIPSTCGLPPDNSSPKSWLSMTALHQGLPHIAAIARLCSTYTTDDSSTASTARRLCVTPAALAIIDAGLSIL
ncbi:hypothetical protein DFH06DRAFT_1149735 [Mycena polygramma]|nr:hypothetical protein DFH06DRAFT_1152718 [Mycena polygramma]KAJ7607001.1 hypothetical protein DFH06DRAFT_1149735 [Mycena polygramma]